MNHFYPQDDAKSPLRMRNAQEFSFSYMATLTAINKAINISNTDDSPGKRYQEVHCYQLRKSTNKFCPQENRDKLGLIKSLETIWERTVWILSPTSGFKQQNTGLCSPTMHLDKPTLVTKSLSRYFLEEYLFSFLFSFFLNRLLSLLK